MTAQVSSSAQRIRIGLTGLDLAFYPALLLLTSLPLMFDEGFSLKGGGSEALRRLQSRYRVEPISVSSAPELSRGQLLLVAQPLAQTPENLVALDNWVRGGGRALLFV